MSPCLEVMEACLRKTESTSKASQEQMRAKIKTDLEQMKSTESEDTADTK
jgi:ElaB/YqjD/DUF883 family membrane-anchored ribosome-binding protein